MEKPVEKIVIVGSGQAGVETAAALRANCFAGTVTILGEEPDLPYQRPPLSKEFLKSVDSAPLPLKGPAFYDAHAIELRLGVVVTRLDRAGRSVELTSGERIGYDHLVIATGARNRIPDVPGLDAGNVMELRTLAHARALTARLDGLRHVTIVGGGFIGLEVAALLRQRDVAVDLLEATDRLMGRVLSREMGEWFRAFHARTGTRLRFGTVAKAVENRDGKLRVQLSDGEALDTDAIMVAAGVVPNAEMAAEAGLAVENGIVVDELLLTADPAISAIGDCAAHPNPFGMGMVRLESVQNAVDQAKCVAARLTGNAHAYDSLPWFWSNQGEARLQIAGLAVGVTRAVTRGDPESGRFSVFLYRDEQLVAVESVSSPADHMVARRVLSARGNIPAATAADPGADLKALVPRPSAAA